MTMTKNDVRNWLANRFAQDLKVSPDQVPLDVNFDRVGLDSLTLLTILADLSDHLDQELQTSLLMDHPNIDRLATHLGSDQTN